MILTRLIPAFALALGLAACDKPAQPPAAPQAPAATAAPAAPVAPAAPLVALDQEGLRLVAATGSTVLVAFDQPTDTTVSALAGALGAPRSRSTNSECGAGPIDFVEWSNGLSALFQNDKFVGWSLGGHGASGVPLTTLDGVGVGSSRAELKAALPATTVEETTLGQEFTAGAYSGILSGPGADAKIETIWAGVSCVFR